MARKQVLVQLDADLLARLDTVATAAGISRSALIRRAAERLIQDLEEAEWDRRYEESFAAEPEPDDPSEDEALLRLAAENWPDWNDR